MSLLLLLLACAPEPEDSARPDYTFVPYAGGGTPEDPLTTRLCAEAADPEGAPDKVFIDCAVEGVVGYEAAPKDRLKVVAWNLERGLRLDDQLPELAELDADILLISEADRGCARTGGRNVPLEVSTALEMNYAFGVEFVELPRPEPMGAADDSCEHGNFVASRYPIGNVDVFRHASNLSWYEEGERRLGGRVAITADVQVGERLVHATVVHFESKIAQLEVQVAQAEETASRVLERPFAKVAGGDTNAPIYGADLFNGTTNDGTTQAFLSRGFTDPHTAIDPADRATIEPGFIIDLLFVADVEATDPGLCDTSGCGGLSDHRAVWATLAP